MRNLAQWSLLAVVTTLMTTDAGAQSGLARYGREGPLYTAHNAAERIIELSTKAHGVMPTGQVQLSCKGTWYHAGHTARPGLRESVPIQATILFDSLHDLLQMEERIDEAGGEHAQTVVRAGVVTYQDFGQQQPVTPSRDAAVRLRYLMAALFPSRLLSLVKHRSLVSLGGPSGAMEQTAAVAFTDDVSGEWGLTIDLRSGLLQRVERLYQDEVRGDDVEAVELADYQSGAANAVPRRLRWWRYGEVEKELRCEVLASDPRPATQRVVERASSPPPLAAEVGVINLAPGLYLLELQRLDHRVLVIQKTDHVLVVEAPKDSSTGALILAKISELSHGKPVRYLLLSHHHPDHAGGLRAFVAHGAQIVTTTGNIEYLRALAEAPWTLEPDAQARNLKKPQFLAVRGRFELSDNAVEAYDIGPASAHTDEHLLFYVPSAQLVFVGDLVRKKVGEPLRVGPRALGLYRSILQLGRPVRRIISAWPLHGYEREIPMSMLEAAIRQQEPPR